VDALETEYATRPVIFLEQNVDVPVGNRLTRWYAGYSGPLNIYLPLVMVDSGHQISNGSKNDFKAAYRPLVNAELARPPQAELEAYVRNVGSRVRVYTSMRNTSGSTLSAAANGAALHALVWEDAHAGVTNQIVRAAPWLGISPEVASNGSFTATLETPDLAGVNWQALHTVVLADYVPGPGTAYDALQAAVAEPAGLSIDPDTTTLAVDANHPDDRSARLRLRGPYVLNWTATPDVEWLAVTPGSAEIAVQPTVRIAAGRLAPGWQEGRVSVHAASEDGMAFSQTVAVRVFLGPRVLRLGSATTSPGKTVSLSVDLSALGDESSVSFSVAFHPAVLGSVSVGTFGAITADMLTLDGTQGDAGRLGVRIDLPPGQTFTQGDVRLLQLSFTVAPAATAGAATVRFVDQPTGRQLTDASGNALTATFADGTVTIPLTGLRPPRRHIGRIGP
jgi:hypothetical protein